MSYLCFSKIKYVNRCLISFEKRNCYFIINSGNKVYYYFVEVLYINRLNMYLWFLKEIV